MIAVYAETGNWLNNVNFGAKRTAIYFSNDLKLFVGANMTDFIMSAKMAAPAG